MKNNQIQVIILFLYIVTRLLGIFYFAPHNDEVIYTQYAQLIASDWGKFKFISMDGTMFIDYKAPLQFWLTSLTVNLWKNPLIGVRIWSLMLGFCGLFFTHLLVKRIWGNTVAIIVAFLIIISEYYFYFDSVGVTEVYIYGLGAAFLYFLHDFFSSNKWGSGAIAILLFSAMLITKQSGMVWILFAGLIPLLVLLKDHSKLKDVLRNYKKGIKMYSLLGTGVLLAMLIKKIFVPSKFNVVKYSSDVYLHTRKMSEVFEFPFQSWIGKLKLYFSHILASDFSFIYVLFLLGVLGLLFTLREKLWTYIVFITMWIFSFLPMVILLKTSLARHFGMGLYFWYILVGVVLAAAYEKIKKKIAIVLIILPLSLGVALKSLHSYSTLIRWNHTDFAGIETPHFHWASGLGISEMIEKIKKLSPHLIIFDPQWGHPGTDIQIFKKYYSETQIEILSQETINKLGSIRKILSNTKKDVYFIFNANTLGRPWVKEIIENTSLCSKKEIIPKKFRKQVAYESGIVFCKVKGFI
tara:strand:+ start:3081 stop:4649 length:1569 start_codon:yes stop_codon:yes gene_type:complete